MVVRVKVYSSRQGAKVPHLSAKYTVFSYRHARLGHAAGLPLLPFTRFSFQESMLRTPGTSRRSGGNAGRSSRLSTAYFVGRGLRLLSCHDFWKRHIPDTSQDWRGSRIRIGSTSLDQRVASKSAT